MTSKERSKGDRRRFRTSMAWSKSSIDVFLLRSRFLIGRRLRWKKAGGDILKSSQRFPELEDVRLLAGIETVMLDGSMKMRMKTGCTFGRSFSLALDFLVFRRRLFLLSSLADL
jgi:hypothetical protein